MNNDPYMKSGILGAGLGFVFGLILGGATGALTGSWSGVIVTSLIGGMAGTATGALTGMLAVHTAGVTGGVSVGAYTGMAFGAFLGLILGIFIPESFRLSVLSLDVLILNVIMQGRFEAAILVSFLLSCLATAVGAWVGGRNLQTRDTGMLK